MIDKRVATAERALDGIADGASVMVNGFGGAGVPGALVRALAATGVRDLTIITNSLRHIDEYAPALFTERRVRRAVASAARSRGPDTAPYERQWLDGDLEIEMVPQGTFAERMRAAGAGIPAFFTPTGAGTLIAEGKEVREFDGQPCLLEHALRADFALLRAARADRWGNVAFRGTQANFGPVMAMASRVAVVEVESISAEPLPPDAVHLPGIYVDRVIELPDLRGEVAS